MTSTQNFDPQITDNIVQTQPYKSSTRCRFFSLLAALCFMFSASKAYAQTPDLATVTQDGVTLHITRAGFLPDSEISPLQMLNAQNARFGARQSFAIWYRFTSKRLTKSQLGTLSVKSRLQTPDGDILFMGASSMKNRDIYSIRADGSGLRKLTKQMVACFGAGWSFDKKSVVIVIATKIGVMQKRQLWRYNLAILDVRTKNIHNIAIAGHPEIKTFAPAFSPSGKQIIFTGSSGKRRMFLYLVNRDGSHLKQITRSGNENCGRFTRDGKKIVYSSWRNKAENIFTCNADGSNERQVTRNSVRDQTPIFSPNGRKIAFVSWRTGNYQIYSCNADGTNTKQLTKSKEKNFGATFSPDGKQIAFMRRLGEYEQIFVMNADGTNQHRISFGLLYATFPDWR